MRIIHLTDAYHPRLGGIEAQVSRLAARQAEQGHDVEVITTTPARPGDHGTSTEHEGLVSVRRLAARMPAGIPVHPRARHYVAVRLTTFRPHIVHLHMGVLTPSTQTSFPAVVRSGVPTVATVHSMWGPAQHGFRTIDRFAHWSRWPVAWSAVSDSAAAPVRRACGPKTSVSVIPNGIDLDAWSVDRIDRTARPTGSALHIVAASRFAPRKRIVPLLKAIDAARHALDPGSLQVTIAGDGPDLDSTRRFASARKLDDIVSMPGRLDGDSLRALYAQADVFAAPAVKESFGIAALEAQASGLTIVSRSRSGIAERLTDGVDGIVADDDAALTTALIRLARDRKLLGALLAYNAVHPPNAGWPVVLSLMDDLYARATMLRSRPAQ